VGSGAVGADLSPTARVRLLVPATAMVDRVSPSLRGEVKVTHRVKRLSEKYRGRSYLEGK
jgi:hypothetical protein